MSPFRKPNTADWLQFLRSCVPYVLGDTGPLQPREVYTAMTKALNAILEATADYDPDDDAGLVSTRALHLQVIEALCLLERDFPLSELSIFVHEILHVPEFVYRLNSVRKYWCFATERFVGWMKGFVKSRSLSVENMVPCDDTNTLYAHFVKPCVLSCLLSILSDFKYTFCVMSRKNIQGALVKDVLCFFRSAATAGA